MTSLKSPKLPSEEESIILGNGGKERLHNTLRGTQPASKDRAQRWIYL